MNPDSLRDHLAQLHTELASSRAVDPRSRELLADILADIQRLLNAPGEAATPQSGSVAERLERMAVQFEADHPTLAASSRRLVDLLGKVGL